MLIKYLSNKNHKIIDMYSGRTQFNFQGGFILTHFISLDIFYIDETNDK